MEKNQFFCALCGVNACKDNGKQYPTRCAGNVLENEAVVRKYKEEVETIAQVSAMTGANYSLTRLEEIMAFANGCGYKKLGLAFCSALSKEAKITSDILRTNGFVVESVICKVGNYHKDIVGLEEEKLMCNPIGQAELFNKIHTDFNIILGLCVGHDTMFIKYSEAPVTVFAVKDRVLGHNPLVAVYMADTFYKERLYGKQ